MATLVERCEGLFNTHVSVSVVVEIKTVVGAVDVLVTYEVVSVVTYIDLCEFDIDYRQMPVSTHRRGHYCSREAGLRLRTVRVPVI